LGLVGVFALLTQVQTINNAVMAASTGVKFVTTAVTSGLAAAQSVLATSTTAEGAASAGATGPTLALAGAFATLSAAGAPVLAAITAIGLAIFGLALAVVAPIIAFTVLVVVLKDLFVTLLDYGIEAMVNAAIGMTLFATAGAAAIVILSVAMATAVTILMPFAIAMQFVAPALMAFGAAMTIAVAPLLVFAAGLYTLGAAIDQFAGVDLQTLEMAVMSIIAFSTMLLSAAPSLYLAGTMVGIPLLALGAGLYLFALGIEQFNDVASENLVTAIGSLLAFSVALLVIAPLASTAMALVGIPLLAFGAGLFMFALAVQQFNDIAMEQIPVMVMSLLALSFALIPLIPFAPILVTVGYALITLGLGLMSIGSGLESLSEGSGGIETLAALGGALESIALFGVAAALSIQALGPAIAALSLGMALLPKENLLTFAIAMKSVSQLTPESVTAVDQIVDAAGRYVEIQAEMKSPDQDSFVQAMKEVFSGASGEGGGQDVVLVLNGRELGRAVDAAISKRHNLKIA
jgi:hypothetical protein